MERKIALAQGGASYQELLPSLGTTPLPGDPCTWVSLMTGPSFPSNQGLGVERGREVVGWKIRPAAESKAEERWKSSGGGEERLSGRLLLDVTQGNKGCRFWGGSATSLAAPPPLLHWHQEAETQSTEGLSVFEGPALRGRMEAPRVCSPAPGLQSLEVEGAPRSPPWRSECQGPSHCQSLPQVAWPPSKEAKGTDGAAPARQPSNLERKARSPCLLLRQRPRQGLPRLGPGLVSSPTPHCSCSSECMSSPGSSLPSCPLPTPWHRLGL